MKELSSDIIADAVRKYLQEEVGKSVPVVVYFSQKYEYEDDDKWEFCGMYVTPVSQDPDGIVQFDYDFCEGQTDVKNDIKNIYITTADDVFQFYYDCHYDYIKPIAERSY